MEKNEIELVVSTPTIKGVAKYAEAIKEAEKSIGLIKPTIGNASLCAEEVTKTNKRKAEIKSALKKVSDMWDEPLKKALEPILEAQKSYEEKAKEYQAEVLRQKKLAYVEEKAKPEFSSIAQAVLVGGEQELPPFEEIYDEGWYGLKQADLHDRILSAVNAKIGERKTAEEAKAEGEDAPHFIKVFGLKDLAKAEELLRKNLIRFEDDR